MGLSDFKPLAFGLLSGDKPKDALKNAFGIIPGAKSYFDDQEEKDKAAAAAKTAATGEAPGNATNMKKGGKVKGWGKARGARAAKYY